MTDDDAVAAWVKQQLDRAPELDSAQRDLLRRVLRPVPRQAWSPAEVAESWGVPIAQVYRLVQQQELPAKRVGRHIRIPVDAAEAFLRGEAPS